MQCANVEKMERTRTVHFATRLGLSTEIVSTGFYEHFVALVTEYLDELSLDAAIVLVHLGLK